MTPPRAFARWRLPLAALLLAFGAGGWLDPYASVRQGNRLYADGKYDEAATTYNQALVDDPDSARVHFNLGDAQYKQGKYAEALTAFEKVPMSDKDPDRSARVAYNAGNAKVRLGEAAEGAEPQQALTLYAEALVAYRRALAAKPDDEDAKFNHELVEKKLKDLKERLEEQRKKQEQEQQQQDQDQEQQGEQGQEQQDQQQQGGEAQQEQEEKAQQGREQKEEPKPEQAPAPEPKPKQAQEPAPEQQAAGQQAAGERADEHEEMSRQEATALLDSQRDQEVRPEEIVKQLQGVVAEPSQDW